MATPVFKAQGTSTIQWNTSSALGTPSGAFVESIACTPKYSGPIHEVEDGTGAAFALGVLDDGFTAKLKVEYDSSLTWPAVGTAVTLTLPKFGGTGGTTSYACTCSAITPDLARKRNAQVDMELVYRPNITPA